MPKPNKGEAKQDYLKRCTTELISKENKTADQAYAMCNSYWDEAQGKMTRPVITLSAPLELRADPGNQEKPKSLHITAYTGKPVSFGWGFPVVIETSGIEIKSKFPILRDHKRDQIIGIGRKNTVEKGNLYISGDFSQKSMHAKEVMELADEGFPWQASMGIWPKKVKELPSSKHTMMVNGQEMQGPLEVWTQSTLGEVSILPLGADDDTAAIALSKEISVPVEIEAGAEQQSKEVSHMEITLKLLEAEAPNLLSEIRAAAKQEGIQEGKTQGVQKERSRIVSLLKAEADQGITLKAIEDGTSSEAAFRLFYEAERKKRVDGLAQLAASAPPSVGQTEPKNDAMKAEKPGDKVARLAKELAEKEKIDVATATNRVLAANSNLAKDYYASFDREG